MAKAGPRKDPVIRQQIRELVEQGLSTRQIAVKLDYSTQRIWKLRREIEQGEQDQVKSA